MKCTVCQRPTTASEGICGRHPRVIGAPGGAANWPAKHVRFSTREYEMNHGRSPRGYGSWGFVPAEKSRLINYLPFVKWFHSMNYGDAKRAASKAFASEGVSEVVVCS